MKRPWLRIIGAVAVVTTVLVTAGCVAGSAVLAGYGTLAINVTDAPPRAEVTSIMITLSSVEVHKATPGEEEDPTGESQTQDTGDDNIGWRTITVPEAARTFDLLQIEGIEQLLASAQLGAGKYTQVRLMVDKAEVALNGEALQPAIVPSGKLRVIFPFEIVTGETTTLTIDFDAEKSVNVNGQGGIQVKPVIKLLLKPPKSGGQSQINEQTSQHITRDFLRNAPTFKFDGVEGTLTLKETKALEQPLTWQFTYEFDSSHAGYGDRTAQAPAEATTPHVAIITVENGNVTAAVLDGVWNELTQQPIVTQ